MTHHILSAYVDLYEIISESSLYNECNYRLQQNNDEEISSTNLPCYYYTKETGIDAKCVECNDRTYRGKVLIPLLPPETTYLHLLQALERRLTMYSVVVICNDDIKAKLSLRDANMINKTHTVERNMSKRVRVNNLHDQEKEMQSLSMQNVESIKEKKSDKASICIYMMREIEHENKEYKEEEAETEFDKGNVIGISELSQHITAERIYLQCFFFTTFDDLHFQRIRCIHQQDNLVTSYGGMHNKQTQSLISNAKRVQMHVGAHFTRLGFTPHSSVEQAIISRLESDDEIKVERIIDDNTKAAILPCEEMDVIANIAPSLEIKLGSARMESSFVANSITTAATTTTTTTATANKRSANTFSAINFTPNSNANWLAYDVISQEHLTNDKIIDSSYTENNDNYRNYNNYSDRAISYSSINDNFSDLSERFSNSESYNMLKNINLYEHQKYKTFSDLSISSPSVPLSTSSLSSSSSSSSSSSMESMTLPVQSHNKDSEYWHITSTLVDDKESAIAVTNCDEHFTVSNSLSYSCDRISANETHCKKDSENNVVCGNYNKNHEDINKVNYETAVMTEEQLRKKANSENSITLTLEETPNSKTHDLWCITQYPDDTDAMEEKVNSYSQYEPATEVKACKEEHIENNCIYLHDNTFTNPIMECTPYNMPCSQNFEINSTESTFNDFDNTSLINTTNLSDDDTINKKRPRKYDCKSRKIYVSEGLQNNGKDDHVAVNVGTKATRSAEQMPSFSLYSQFSTIVGNENDSDNDDNINTGYKSSTNNGKENDDIISPVFVTQQTLPEYFGNFSSSSSLSSSSSEPSQ